MEFLIAGGGTAGCILANRLSEDPANRVVMIEAGDRDLNPLIHMPAGYFGLMKGGLANWNYETVPQSGLHGRQLYYPRGKVLGGSSSINAMQFIRGNRGDYDGWAALGNRGWSYDECLPYFRKMESYAGGESHWRGGSGPLQISGPVAPAKMNPLARMWIEAGLQAGYSYNADVNGETQEGFGPTQGTFSCGYRSSAATAYLKPAQARPNLKVITGALVTRVGVRSGRAVSLAYIADGREHVLETDGEIILSNGAINTPQTLQLSGIGDPDDLGALGISVVHALPGVGKNLQDHCGLAVQEMINQPLSLLKSMKPLNAALAVAQYYLFRTGPTAANGLEAQAFIKSEPQLAEPDLQYHFQMILLENDGRDVVPHHGFAPHITNARPKSRGTVKLRSSDPTQAPAIDPCFLTDPDDITRIRAGIRIARELIAQPAFAGIRAGEYAPGAALQSDAELDDFIRRTVTSIYHSVGTCMMGHSDMAVVDDRLRVHGIDRLRVVDASVMPTLVSGNTNAAVSMIAEKAADYIIGKVG